MLLCLSILSQPLLVLLPPLVPLVIFPVKSENPCTPPEARGEIKTLTFEKLIILKTGWSLTFKIPKRLTDKLFFAQAKVQ